MLEAVDAVRIVSLLSWRYRDPGALVAERIGASPRQTAVTTPGGNTPQSLVNRTALDIAAGRNDVVLIGGAEAWRTRMSFRSTGDRPDWTQQDESVPEAEVIGDEFTMTHPAEMNRGIIMPVQVYPMFEQALRAAAGRSIDEHLVRISELWSRFSAVAASNPNAWSQQAYTAEEIRTPGPDNRWIGFPYPKLMNSNNNVEQGAALLMCSVEAAERAGVPATVGCSLTAAPTRTTPTPCRIAAICTRRRPFARSGGRRSSSPASVSTTSRTSTCTRASRRRCRSRPPSSDFPTTTRAVSSPSPAVCRSRADRGTTT